MTNHKPNKPDHIFIDQKRHDWEAPAITGAQLKQLAGVDPQTFDVWQARVPNEPNFITAATEAASVGQTAQAEQLSTLEAANGTPAP